jgi:hypothetical protein
MFFSDDMRQFVALLQQHGVQFAVCGGFAVAHHGFLRATMDFDLLVLPNPDNASRIMSALEDFGFGAAGVPESAFLSPGTAITLGAQPNQIDLLTSMGPRPTEEIIAGAIEGKIGGLTVPIVSLDDLLHAKKASDRAKDRIDAEELERIHSS